MAIENIFVFRINSFYFLLSNVFLVLYLFVRRSFVAIHLAILGSARSLVMLLVGIFLVVTGLVVLVIVEVILCSIRVLI